MTTKVYMTDKELAERWSMPVATLRTWRYEGKGPTYIKLGKHVRYKPEVIEAYEEASVHRHTSDPGPGRVA